MQTSRVLDLLDDALPALLRQHDIPGLAMGICGTDGTFAAQTLGVTRRDGPSVTRRTMWSLQSQTKTYTAVLVLIAAQRGLVDLDLPVTSYLPGFTVRSTFEERPEARMTLRHLLSHTAGFTHEAPIGSNFRVGRESFAAHCESIGRTWLRFPVGEQYAYSNLGIDLAAHVLESVMGESYPRLVERDLLGPLGLHRTSADAKVIARDDDRALGHNKKLPRLPVRVPMTASGGMYGSVEDSMRFALWHLHGGDGLLSSDLRDQLTRNPVPPADPDNGYGLGMAVVRRHGHTFHGHSGGGFGFLSDNYWVPERGFGVTVLTNSVDHPLQQILVYCIARELLRSPTARTRTTPETFLRAVERAVAAARPRSGEDALLATVEPAAPVAEWTVRAFGQPVGAARMWRLADGTHVFAFPEAPAVGLEEIDAGLFRSDTGEMLDLTSTPATYANISLTPRRADRPRR
jgi:CubicO group peptidase (beta-lactamase class C family)